MQNILILAAMEVEERALLQDRSHRAETVGKQLPVTFKTLDLPSHHTIRVGCTGIGPVNAALALIQAGENVPVDAVILLGVGGALVPQLNIGDVVIAQHVMQHDSFASMEDGFHWMAAGDLYLTGQASALQNPAIACDPKLVQWMSQSFASEQTHFGTILSGSEFVATLERKNAIARANPQSLMVDMEAAGVAQVAKRLNLPFAVAKTVADRLNPDHSIGHDYQKFLDAASRHAGEVLSGLIRQLMA